MDKWLTAADIQQRYQCSGPTARKRMRQMIHMESPLLVRLADVLAWEMQKTIDPNEKRIGKIKRGKRNGEGLYRIPRRA